MSSALVEFKQHLIPQYIVYVLVLSKAQSCGDAILWASVMSDGPMTVGPPISSPNPQ